MPAAPITSEVQVCNAALARIGQKPVSDIETPTTWVEDLCALHYPRVRRALLRSYVFNFAKKLDVLTVSGSVTPAFGYGSAFALPNDFIRLLALGDYTINDDTPADLYDIVNGHVYTDEETSADSLAIAYIFDETTVPKWDTLFLELMVLTLAQKLSYSFTLQKSLITSLEAELKDVRLQAAAVAGQEKPPRRRQVSRFIQGRRMGGIVRDNTRHSI